jgi:hypothetical protein
MKIYFYLFLFFLFTATTALANFNTPGTGVSWNLDSLVANSDGLVTFSAGEYFVNDTIRISLNDTLYINDNAIVKFAPLTFLSVRGTLLINPPDNVTFTAQDLVPGYFGVRIDTTNSSVVRKLTFEYATSFRLNDCTILIDSCIFRYNNHQTATTFGNGAVSLFRAKPVITNSLFFENKRAAIQGGSNIANAPTIIGNTFMGNNTTNQNVPQINMGATGTDTVFILNNKILRASTNSGGIGFLPLGDVRTVISGNVIMNNRYGMTFNGGSNINALISYNQIDSNNTQNNPTLGGSGIAFTGGSSTSQQNSIVTGNLIRWNLWGVTIQGRSRPNLGNILNADTTDDGKNYFLENTNDQTPFIDLYNNSIDTIYAQNNHWGTEDTSEVELRIFHFPDNNALGPVIYLPNIIPVELISFTAAVLENNITLTWQTATELNNSGFELLRDNEVIAFIPGYGTTSEPRNYTYTDLGVKQGIRNYILAQIDLDGTRTLLKEIELEVDYLPSAFALMQNYPNPFNPSTKISFAVPVTGMVNIRIYNSLGEEVALLIDRIMEAGTHTVDFDGSKLSSGVYLYQMISDNFISSKKMIMMK